MLPLLLLKTAQAHPVLLELKNGETYNGHMLACDSWMNVHLREVICTSKDGDKFWRMPETYVRGNTIKYLRVPNEVIDKVKDEKFVRAEKRPAGNKEGGDVAEAKLLAKRVVAGEVAGKAAGAAEEGEEVSLRAKA
eukprot:CAMPEP_0206134474 /NCGR_PEP_ID=MMETSP1473-20131121/27_1 /ASSEMBLY_ACC=CAM_ASM_001109 /TAXON_ID=1461547 /ORGANISM="Stichococcus sp, Strain RCC1054" /LENGTH=135 /DNA_ID=CAMNT_0053526081 /DNA_START=172 /DNA_END=580 /DNA_ORIENTATION=+